MSYINSLAQSNYLLLMMRRQQTDTSTYQKQVASGHKADDFSGYSASEGRGSITMRNANERNKQYLHTVTSLQIQTEQAEASLTNVGTLLSGDGTSSNTGVKGTILATFLSTRSDNGQSVQLSAKSALQQVIGMYNNGINGNYVFGGRGTQKPLLDEATLVANIRAAIDAAKTAAGGTLSPTAMQNAVDGVFMDTTTKNLDQSNLSKWFGGTVQDAASDPINIGDNQLIGANISALPNLARTGSTDANTGIKIDPTYAFMDSIRSLAAVAYAKSEDFAGATLNDKFANYQDFLRKQVDQIDLSRQEVNAMTTVNGNNRATLKAAESQLHSQNNTLEYNIAKTEDADQSTAITRLQNLQTQLTATYQVTAMLKNLSLVNYLN